MKGPTTNVDLSLYKPLSVAFFSVALSIYLLLSILKFARLVQIRWLEVKHPIFNWFEFQLLNFRLNKNGFETSLTGSLFVNFHSKNLLNSKRNCLQHVSLVSSLNTKILFIKGAPLKTVSIVDEFLWEIMRPGTNSLYVDSEPTGSSEAHPWNLK